MTTRLFFTDTGVEVPAVTMAQMREVDRVAIEEVGPNLYQMMENAGRNLALTAIEMLGEGWAATPVVVLAGSGGNGGGGICAARHLANRGADVTVVVSDAARLTPVAAEQLAVFAGTTGRQASIAGLDGLQPGLVVDAIIGYSLSGAPRGAVLEMIEWAAHQTVPVVALDVPSGIDSTTGETPGAHVKAQVTLTLALPKTGLDGEAAGEVWLADIGIPVEVYRRAGLEVPKNVFGRRYRIRLRAA